MTLEDLKSHMDHRETVEETGIKFCHICRAPIDVSDGGSYPEWINIVMRHVYREHPEWLERRRPNDAELRRWWRDQSGD